jgi:predicted nucleotidyltransferase
MHFDIDKHTCFLAVTGSHAYGMARPDSDVDIRGAAIPPRGMRESFYKNFAQFLVAKQEGPWGGGPCAVALEALKSHPTGNDAYVKYGEIDLCVFSLIKLVKLAANNNPNVLELLFLDDRDILYQTDDWKKLREAAPSFLSKKCKHTYTGYAMSQLKRIKGHRAWLLDPPKAEPTRKEFDLPEESVLPADVRNQINEAVLKIIRDWQVEDGLDEYITGAAQDTLRDRMASFQATTLQCSDDMLDEKVYELGGASIGLSKDVLYAIKMERKYRAARKHWQQFTRWKTERNEKRAELEAKFGFDTKHASHLIRLLRTGLEILSGEGLLVRRPDAEELMAIRKGAYTYDKLMEESEKLRTAIDEAYKTSTLPKAPPFDDIDAVLYDILNPQTDYPGLPKVR